MESLGLTNKSPLARTLKFLGALSNLWTVSRKLKPFQLPGGSRCWAGTLPPLNPVPVQLDGRKTLEQGAPWWWNSQEGGSWEALSKHGYSLELTFFLGTLREGMTLGSVPLKLQSQNQQSQLQYWQGDQES